MDLHAHLFIDHRHISFFRVFNFFEVGLDCKIILTAKFSQSTVHFRNLFLLLSVLLYSNSVPGSFFVQLSS